MNVTRGATHTEAWPRFKELYRLFLVRLVSLDSFAPGGEIRDAIIPALTVLAIPAYLSAVGACMGQTLLLFGTGRLDPLFAWPTRWFLLLWSFLVIVVIALAQREALFLDRRDRLNLGLLPVGSGLILMAKLASLATAAAVFHLGVNAVPGLIFLMAFAQSSMVPGLRLLFAHQVTLLLESVFVVFAIASLHGVIALCVPRSLVRRVLSWAQSLLLVASGVLFVWEDKIAQWLWDIRGIPHPGNAWFPLAWFLALYDHLLGVAAPGSVTGVRLALLVPPILVLTSAFSCILAYRRDGGGAAASPGEDAPVRPDTAGILDRVVARTVGSDPVARGVFYFACAALRRSPKHALVLWGWIAGGVALALARLGEMLPFDATLSLRTVSVPLLAVAHILPFFGLVGLRLCFGLPVSLNANWLFRLTERPESPAYGRALQAVALRLVLLPSFALLVVLYLSTWGIAAALSHLAFSLSVALLTSELLFLGFRKIPFTCSYLPGKAQLKQRWPIYLCIGLLYCSILCELEMILWTRTAALWSATALLTGAKLIIARWREQASGPGRRLVFEELAPPLLTRLGLYT